MTYEDFKKQTTLTINSIPNVTFEFDEKEINSVNDDYFGKLTVDEKKYLVKVQNECNKIQEGEEQYILSFNYIVRIKSIPLETSDELLYKAVNSFNEKYAILKAIYYKKDDQGHSFWFRNEQLLTTPPDHSIIKNIIISLQSSPKTLISIIKG